MESGFPYGDNIVIGACAAFIILRYGAMLGEKTGRDADGQPPRPLQEFERVIQLPERDRAATVIPIVPEKDYGALNETFAGMRAVDRQFTPEEFLNGARAAFEMVVEAFNTADRETLKMLLSKEIYAEFDAALKAQEEEKRSRFTTLIAITEAKVAEAKLQGNKAQLTVDFVSEQVILLRDEQGNVIEGDPSHQEAIEDQWVFERNLASSDPAWKIIET
jgi:predicted lipid-binding transport protein (Tim44 family)